MVKKLLERFMEKNCERKIKQSSELKKQYIKGGKLLMIICLIGG